MNKIPEYNEEYEPFEKFGKGKPKEFRKVTQKKNKPRRGGKNKW